MSKHPSKHPITAAVIDTILIQSDEINTIIPTNQAYYATYMNKTELRQVCVECGIVSIESLSYVIFLVIGV